MHNEVHCRDTGRDWEFAEKVGLNLFQDSVILTVSDGQMRHDLGELASIGRSFGPLTNDRLSQPPQLRSRLRDEIQHLRKPPAALKPKVEGAMLAEHVGESRVDTRIYSALVEEWEEHSDMCRNACSG
jgi:hypothetical protein